MPEYVHSQRPDESEGFFCRFTFGQFFALLVLEVFTLFFVFYLGARYGRGLLGLDRPPELAAQQAEAPEIEAEAEALGARVATTADPEVQKMAQDLIAKAQTPELKDRIRRMIDEAQPQRAMPEVIAVDRSAPEEAPAAAAATDEVPPREQAPMAAEPPPAAAPTQEPAEPKVLQPAEPARPVAEAGPVRVKSAEHGRYAVQVGAYPQMAEASRFADRWKQKGYPSYLTVADIPGRGRWYRVRIGGFATRDEAARYQREFSSREGAEALVVQNEP